MKNIIELKYREDSRDTPFARHSRKCWSKGIVIVAVPTVSKYCKINIIMPNKTIVGEKLFSQEPKNGNSPLTMKIRELYETYYNKIIAKEQKDDRNREIKTA